MSLSSILIVLLVLILVGVIPGAWPHSANLGYAPVGGVGLLLLILVILVLTGRL